MKLSLVFKHSVTTGLCWGLIGGIIMIIFLNLPIKLAELLQMAAFLMCLIASVLTVNVKSDNKKYFKLFVASFIAFMLMFTVPHIFIAIRDSEEFLWNAFFIMTLIALGSCALLTFLLTRRR